MNKFASIYINTFFKVASGSQSHQTEDIEPWKRYVGDAGSILFGKQLVGFSNPYMRGKDVYYHGGRPESYGKIKQEGIKTMGEMKSRGLSSVSSALDPKVLEESSNMAFVSKSNASARAYQAQASIPRLREVLDELARLRLDNQKARDDYYNAGAKDPNYLSAAEDRFKRMSKVESEVMAIRGNDVLKKIIKDLFTFRNPLTVEFPHGGGPELATNPEYTYLLKNKPLLDLGGLHEAAVKALSKEPGVVGGVGSKYIRGGKGFKWFSRSGIAKSPLRALAGVLGTGGGLALIANGVRDAYQTATGKQ